MVFPFMREILPVVFFVVENLRVDNQTGQLHCTEHTIDNLYSTKTEVILLMTYETKLLQPIRNAQYIPRGRICKFKGHNKQELFTKKSLFNKN